MSFNFRHRFKGRTQPKRDGSMNRTEAAYELVLKLRQQRGEVLWFQFQAMKLRLADRTWYEPDFTVMLADGTLEQHETKAGIAKKDDAGAVIGSKPLIEDDAAVKIKVAAEQYPFTFVMAWLRKGEWAYRTI